MTAALDVDVSARLGAFSLDARFRCEGRLTALFGRSGSGKTSVVNAIAGLLRPERGRILVDGRALFDSERGVNEPPHRRRVGYVFQDARLFPHLTVRQNLLFGRWFSRASAGDGDAFSATVEMLGVGHLLKRRPGALSGGEKQRVAIGRALLARPRLLLMDEPLASLDEARKAEILPYIERLRDAAEIPILYVSHALAEVARLSTNMVVMEDGKAVASGATPEVVSGLSASLLGPGDDVGVLLDGAVAGHEEAYGLTIIATRAGLARAPAIDRPVGAPARLRILASDVLLSLRPLDGVSALNVFAGTVTEIAASNGPSVLVRLDCGGAAVLAQITRKSLHALGLAPGAAVHAAIKTVSIAPFAGRSDGRTTSDDQAQHPHRSR